MEVWVWPATSTQFPVPLHVFKDILTDLLQTHSQATQTLDYSHLSFWGNPAACMHAWGRSAKRRPKKDGETCKYLIQEWIPKGLRGKIMSVGTSVIPQRVPEAEEAPLIYCYDFIITLRPALGVSMLLGINVAPVMSPHLWGLMVLWRGMMDGWRRRLRDTPCTADVL